MKPLLSILLLTCQLIAFSQTQSDPIKIKYNANWEVITSGTPHYTSKVWKEGDKWHKQDFYQDNKIQMDGVYTDTSFKIQDGIFTWYYPDGKISNSCLFVNNKKEGIEATYFNDGAKAALYHYKNGLPVDTSIAWNAKGQKILTIIADKEGNGIQSEYDDNGKLMTSGSMVSGKKEGRWICYDSTGVQLMSLQFQSDSLTATTCLDAAGQPTGGFCIYKRVAEFRGGANGWKRFLEQNLEYPNYAQKKNIQGLVRVQFIVDKSGAVSEFAILSSPHESLSKEVLRLMSLSPKWSPAIVLNTPVMYRHIQSITFRLE